ncbi:hypothetical protein WOLCODRAFT_118552 [Wolfiporia cocos MD-104 SS10]|uniref:Vacuolar ATPase assembly integral membrane protein VMA21 n=1 Tax=Wolfiporia cocos (strain MD-104) TaxID=742152 RepID=A0A2H3JR46_WOLCO|nr:hypothetical protein WOLCODRAFT_118552 [Wolfiporia cocos MD-104 SS10]
MSAQAAVGKLTADTAQQGGVLAKLLIFTAALAVAPIASYFLSKDYMWDGNTTLAAITAIVAANSVLVAFIVVSIREERQAVAQTPHQPVESKKDR